MGIHHARSGSVGEFLRLCTAEPVHQVFGDHQKVGDAFQPPLAVVVIELIQRVEGLELAAGVAIQFAEGHLPVDFRDYRFGAAVPIGVDRHNLPVALHQDIVNPPGVNGKRSNFRKLLLCFPYAGFHIPKQGFHIPDQVSVLFGHTVGKTINLFRLNFAIFQPSDNMTAGGCADIDRKRVFHVHHPYLFNHFRTKNVRPAFA